MAMFYDDGGASYSRFVRKNSPSIDIDILNRFHPDIGSHATVVYDGPTHKSYMSPSRAWERWYCNTLPGRTLPICKSVIHQWMNSTYHHRGVEVKKDAIKGRSVIATEEIPKGHFVNPQDTDLTWRIERHEWEALNKLVEDFPEADMYRALRDFIFAYGFEQQALGIDGWGVSIGTTNTFTNHACSKEEENVDWWKDAYVTEDGDLEMTFSPPFTRRFEALAQVEVASKDIKPGDEVLQDYFSFRVKPDKEYITFLQGMCSEGIGLVVDKEL